MKRDVTITTRAEGVKVWVDGEAVALNNGDGTITVAPGPHTLSWAVRGAPGTTYSVKITSPKEAKLDEGDTFDDDGIDVGEDDFTVNK